jgi:hypothetical protein
MFEVLFLKVTVFGEGWIVVSSVGRSGYLNKLQDAVVRLGYY